MARRSDSALTRLGPLLIAGGSLALLVGAFAFQYIGGLPPCVLCIYQRWPHGIVAALAMAAAFMPAGGAGRVAAVGLLVAAGLVLLTGAGIAGFHVGVEQRWWEGTSACGATAGTASTVAELRTQLLQTQAVRCDEVAWSMLGVSMAGWNMLLSLALAALSFLLAYRICRKSTL